LEQTVKNVISVSFGSVVIHKKPALLRTVVGSSIIVSLYDRFKGIGGVVYPLLPKPRNKNELEKFPQKYATSAIFYGVEKMMELGVENTSQIEAKLIGGTIFTFLEDTYQPSLKELVKIQIQEIEKLLTKIKIEITSKHIGGNLGRAIEFNLDDGMVKIKIMGEEKTII